MILFANAQLPTLLCLLALAIAVCYVLLRTQRNLARNGRDRLPHSAASNLEREKPGYHDGAPRDLLRWEVAMHETARDLSAQLDSKLTTLQHLIREADRAAARLEAAVAATGEPLGRGPLVDAAEQSSPATDPPPVSQAEALRGVGRIGQQAKPSSCDEPGARPERDVRYEEIYTLADYGYPAWEIAQRLGSPVGEIELILSLRDKR